MNDLFNRLKTISDRDIASKVEKVEDFGKDDLEKKSKEDDYKVSKHLKIIKTCSLWVLAGLLAIMILVFFASFCHLFYLYIDDVSNDMLLVKALLKNWVDYVLIVLATLFVQNVFNKKGE